MLVVITGIPGSGKTTVAKKALEKPLNKEGGYELVTYGTVMFEIASSLDLVDGRDEMRKLDTKQQREIQQLAGNKISQMAEEKNIILDTHCTISTPRGFLPGFPEWVLRLINPNIFVLVEADPKEIALRRSGDGSRLRDDEVEEEIRLHQELNRSTAMSYSIFSGCTVKIIKNPQGKLDVAVNELRNILK